jgi:hypothetical protein
MDIFLGRLTNQAMNYAIRSGVAITATYAIRQSNKLLNRIPKSNVRDEFDRNLQKLQHKIQIVSPAIDLIELIAARGNTTLESAVALVKELRLEIQSLGQRIARVTEAAGQVDRKTGKWSSQTQAKNEPELILIINDIKALLDRIEDAVPLINLAITTSGASLSTQLPQTVSPSRLLQASTFLTAGDTHYSISPHQAVQIGPTFTLTVYMLFAGHNRPRDEEEFREPTWKEVIHKARVKVRRVALDQVLNPSSGSDAIPAAEITSPVKLPASDTNNASIRAASRTDEYAYQLVVVEDFDDDRVHDFSDTPEFCRPGPFDDVALAGIRETIPVHEVSKIFYADTSKVLNIGSDAESNHPVLLLKRDLNAVPPRRMAERDGIVPPEAEDEAKYEEQTQELSVKQQADERQQYVEEPADPQQDQWRFPPSLDPEWIAFEVYTESEHSDSDTEEVEDSTPNNIANAREDRNTSQMTSQFSNIHLNSPSPSPSPARVQAQPWPAKVLTSLSLLELLLRLTSLQQFQQQSHLSITDELLTFFLEESASTGAGGDERYRQQLRQEARRRVGWDVYDESPIKRRGEEYQYGYGDGGYESPRSGSVNGSAREWSGAGPALREGGMLSPSPSPSPRASPAANPGKAGRAGWLRREGEMSRKGSPLRPRTALTDEGIGTSPASGMEDKA